MIIFLTKTGPIRVLEAEQRLELSGRRMKMNHFHANRPFANETWKLFRLHSKHL